MLAADGTHWFGLEQEGSKDRSYCPLSVQRQLQNLIVKVLNMIDLYYAAFRRSKIRAACSRDGTLRSDGQGGRQRARSRGMLNCYAHTELSH